MLEITLNISIIITLLVLALLRNSKRDLERYLFCIMFLFVTLAETLNVYMTGKQSMYSLIMLVFLFIMINVLSLKKESEL